MSRIAERTHRRAVGVVLAVCFLGVVGWTLLSVSGWGGGGQLSAETPLPAIARRAMLQALPAFLTTEPVSAVVYGFRGFDTFGETFLLFAAIVSVVVLTRAKETRHGFIGEERAGHEEQQEEEQDQGGEQKAQTSGERDAQSAEREEEGRDTSSPRTPDDEPVGTQEPDRAQAMTVITRTSIRAMLPLLLVAGFYLVAENYSPGGGFPAGAVMLGVILMAYTAFGYARISGVVNPDVLEIVEQVGAVAIVALFAIGLPLTGSFGGSWVPLAPQETLRSGGMLQVFSISEFVEVGSGLTIAVFALLGMRHDWVESDESDDEEDGAGEEDARS